MLVVTDPVLVVFREGKASILTASVKFQKSRVLIRYNFSLNWILMNESWIMFHIFLKIEVKSKRKISAARYEPLNPSNAELNPICHLLLLLGDLTFMGPCMVSIFQYTRVYPTRCNVTQFIYIWKLLYMFRVVLAPISRSTLKPVPTLPR
jgi:hypothetical protein